MRVSISVFRRAVEYARRSTHPDSNNAGTSSQASEKVTEIHWTST
jgi:hypothetical protein